MAYQLFSVDEVRLFIGTSGWHDKHWMEVLEPHERDGFYLECGGLAPLWYRA